MSPNAICTRDRLGSDGDVVSEPCVPSFCSMSHSCGVCSPSMSAPRSKAQRRLQRRHMAWLAHVAYDRATLLARRTVEATNDCKELAGKPYMLRVVSTNSVACQASLDASAGIISKDVAEQHHVMNCMPASVSVDG
eukprot:TRINITY_DN8493_c0_g1_i1.p2 TRINITY_DN8493_c0_g1~~TRINITY_DN8493_c0_g1_i1.p2  ORF type:complete len:153 (-),score=12.21 TRINITY_DN8493_c0_g1_i1:797-1204(-)